MPAVMHPDAGQEWTNWAVEQFHRRVSNGESRDSALRGLEQATRNRFGIATVVESDPFDAGSIQPRIERIARELGIQDTAFIQRTCERAVSRLWGTAGDEFQARFSFELSVAEESLRRYLQPGTETTLDIVLDGELTRIPVPHRIREELNQPPRPQMVANHAESVRNAQQ
jgi:hypothetical protein